MISIQSPCSDGCPSSSSLVIHKTSQMHHVPEILERIFQHLTQHSLRFATSLVCKQWYLASRASFHETVHWAARYPPLESEQLAFLKSLRRANTLICSRGVSFVRKGERTACKYANEAQNWSVFQEQLTVVAASGGFVHIEHLTFAAELDSEAWSIFIPVLVSLGSRLTSLKIEQTPLECVLSLSKIKELCPVLRHLRLLAPDGQRHQVLALREEGDREQTKWPTLRTCVIENLNLTASILEPFLKSCSNLLELRLVSIAHGEQGMHVDVTPASHIFVFPAARRLFFERVATYCPYLMVLHVSLSEDAGQTQEVLEDLPPFSVFPMVHAFGFSSRSMSDATFLALNIHKDRNQLTSIEIDGGVSSASRNEMDLQEQVGIMLHRFLCDAPSLQHLKAGRFYLPIELLSVQREDLSKMVEYSSEAWQRHWCQDRPRKIWACRGLQTLHLRFEQCHFAHGSDEEASRTVYGYISRVCPDLQDLSIFRRKLPLVLDGGLCLLTQLKNLRRLTLHSFPIAQTLYEADIDWIQPTYKEDAFFSRGIQLLAQLVDLYKVSTPNEDVGGVYAGPEPTLDIKGLDMSHLGQIEDLLEYVQERQLRAGERPWPLLELIEVVQEWTNMPFVFDETPAAMFALIKEYRPEIQLVLRRT